MTDMNDPTHEPSDHAATPTDPVADPVPVVDPADVTATAPAGAIPPVFLPAADPTTPRAQDAEPTHEIPVPDTEPTSVLPPAPTSAPTASVPPAFTPPAPAASPAPPRRFARTVAGVTGVILLSGLSGVAGAAIYDQATGDGGGFGPVATTTHTSLDSPATDELPASSVEQVADSVLPSTVVINVTGAGSAGQGTGVVISEDGTIITNNHVVEAAAFRGTITVAFSDGTNAPATIVGRDVATDVAVIKAKDVSGLTPATLGTSRNLRVGQRVVAIGSPFGLEATVTEGIVSALNRPVSPGDENQSQSTPTIFPAIQTDAAINPGNSGGPLVDLTGRVIGINSAISTGGTGNGSVGLGFAIPIDLVRSVSEQILAGGTVEHAQIGVTVGGARGSDNLTAIGAEIGSVRAGSAGEKAGLKAGDIVTAVEGHPVATSDALVASIRGYRPGDTITLTILRGSATSEVKVTLDSDSGSLS